MTPRFHSGTQAVVLTISDRCFQGTQQDLSGPAVARLLLEAGVRSPSAHTLPDEFDQITEALRRYARSSSLIVTTGGTGLAARDVTPEATRQVCDRLVDGIAEQMRAAGLAQTPLAPLSRAVCGTLGTTLIVNLPGSPAGAECSLAAVLPLLPHALDLLAGDVTHEPAAKTMADQAGSPVRFRLLDSAPALHHSRFGFLKKWNLALLGLLKPLGLWGIGIIALVDSAAIPMPLDAMVVDYVANDHARALLYCFMAALGSSIGSLLPYYFGRAGGELFLLKRINRQRYERLRDRFEKQEFLAIMLPAMAPPPFPVKLFELAAGVFEMRPPVFFGAMFLGKFIRFTAVSFLIIFYGQRILDSITSTMHDHLGLALAICGVVLLALAIYVVRKLFDRRKGAKFPVEEEMDSEG